MPRTKLNTFDLGICFIRRRRKLGLSQEKMAERYGMQRGKYAQWELGVNPTLKDVPRVCKMLGITPNELFGRKGTPVSKRCKCNTRINLPSTGKQMCVDCLTYYDIKSGEKVEIKHQR